MIVPMVVGVAVVMPVIVSRRGFDLGGRGALAAVVVGVSVIMPVIVSRRGFDLGGCRALAAVVVGVAVVVRVAMVVAAVFRSGGRRRGRLGTRAAGRGRRFGCGSGAAAHHQRGEAGSDTEGEREDFLIHGG